MKTEKQNIGRRGEELACLYLENRGHNIIAHNWRFSHLEVDIITLEAGALHFVEVKSRTAPCLTAPQTNVDYKKKYRLAHAANAFLHSDLAKSLPYGVEISFDILTVVFDQDRSRIEYYPRAFTPMGHHGFF